MPDADAVTAAIGKVHDPIFERPLEELGTVGAVEVEGETATVEVRVSSPSDQTKTLLHGRIAAALEPLGITQLVLNLDVRVPTRETTSSDPIPDVKNVILVMSGKGGVGKSTVAANLALALKRSGTRVGLLDADIYGPSVPTMLGIMGHPQTADGKSIEPLQRFGVKLMSIGFLLEDDKQAVVWRGPMLHGALQQFISDVAWGALDYLILDLPPGTGDVALTLAQKCRLTGAVIVTTPQEVALQDVYKSVSMCTKLDIPVLGIVENMSYFMDSAGVRHELFGAGGGRAVAEFSGAPLLGQIPIDLEVRTWGDDGTPVVQAAPNSDAAKALLEIAEALTSEVARSHDARSESAQAPKDSGPKRLRILR